jgi:hypothetical protein
MILSGYLLASPSGKEITQQLLFSGIKDAKYDLLFEGQFKNLRHWERYEFLSGVPIEEDDLLRGMHGPPFRYLIVCVRSAAKMMFLAERKKVAEFVIGRLNRKIFPNLRRVSILLDRLIDSCQEQDSEYLITALHGRFSGSDKRVNKISLYGDDITDSTIFREQRHLFNFYSCGIARRLYDNLLRMNLGEESEIMLIGNDGFVSTRVVDRDRASEVIRIINLVMKNRWVDDWVPGLEMG